jgi:hypothetical protein
VLRALERLERQLENVRLELRATHEATVSRLADGRSVGGKVPANGTELSIEEDEEECDGGLSYPPESTPSTELFRYPA